MRAIGNILWFIFGGGILAVLWALAGIVCCCTLFCIPLGIQCFKFTTFVLWPFGRNIVFSNRTGSYILNLIWIIAFGWELAIASFVLGLLWCATIVGIPFGMQCFRFSHLALVPFGAHVV